MDIDPNKVTLEATSTPTFKHKAAMANTVGFTMDINVVQESIDEDGAMVTTVRNCRDSLNTHRLAGCAATNSTGNAYFDYLVSPFLRLRRVDYPPWDVNCSNAYRDIHSYGAHSTPC